MKAQQYRDMSEVELLQRVDDLRQSIFNLRVRATTKDLANTAALGLERRDLARVITLLREKGLKV